MAEPLPLNQIFGTAEESEVGRVLLALEIKICYTSFYDFVKMAWVAIFPESLLDGRHIKAVCDHLQALAEGQFDNLIINIPPGHGKSRIASVLFPAWCMGVRNLRDQWLCTALAAKLSNRDCEAQRDLMLHSWFQERWPSVNFASTGSSSWHLTDGGKRDTTSKGARATGLRGHYRLVDDLHDLSDSSEEIQKGLDWYNTTWSSRDNFGVERPKEIIIMQRVGPGDVTGHLMATEPEHWVHLCLPLEYDPEDHCITPIFEDWRRVKGELLWPEAYDQEWVSRKKLKIGPKNWSTQYNQKPFPDGGSEFEEAWFQHRFRRLAGYTVEMTMISVDCAFKDKDSSDYVVFQFWVKVGARYYILGQIRRRMNYPQMRTALVEYRENWIQNGVWPDIVVVEDKANGSALLSELEADVEGIVPYEPKDPKIVRWRAVTGQWEAGQIFLPDAGAVFINSAGVEIPLSTGFVSEFVSEHLAAPTGQHDDQIDAAAQALLMFRQSYGLSVVAQSSGAISQIYDDDERYDFGYAS